MKKRILSIIMATSVACGMLAGCGSSEAAPAAPAADTAKEETAEAPAAEEEAPAAEEVAEVSDNSGEKFYIYSWNTELQDRLEYVWEVYPELKDQVVYVNVGDDKVYQEKIDGLLQAPDTEEYPDMIAFEAAYIMKYTNSDYTLPITDLGL